jgi:hypothetical protein
MKKSLMLEKRKVQLVCSSCGSVDHTWKDVYYDSGTVLKKADRQYITWCSKANQFILSD